VSADVRQRHEERSQQDAKRLEQLVAAFRGVKSVRHSITEEQLEHARHWARCCFEPWARQQREERLARRWREWEEIGWVRVRFRGLPATNSESACALLVEAGVCRVEDEGHPVRFMMGQRRGSTCRVTITEVTVLLNDNLKEVWEGSRMIGGKRSTCEENQAEGDEEEQTECTATLSPTTSYSADLLQRWVQIWHILGP
jgi:hypothetical protein